jgi:hypothetical protein
MQYPIHTQVQDTALMQHGTNGAADVLLALKASSRVMCSIRLALKASKSLPLKASGMGSIRILGNDFLSFFLL